MPAPKWYSKIVQYQNDGAASLDWDTDTIKVMLTTSTYVPDQDAHDYKNDVTNEITGTGYTAGGVTLTGKSVTYDAATNKVRLIAADAQWTSATFTARYAVYYKDTGTATTSPLIGFLDFGSDVSVTAGTFTLDHDTTNGIFTATIS